MKRFLFFLTLLPIVSSAQLHLGLNAGGQYNIPTRISNDKGRINGYVSARALKDIGEHLQLGLTIDAGKFTLRSDWEVYTNESFTTKNKLLYSAGTYIAPTLTANYKQEFLKGYFYGGLALSYFKSFKDKGDTKLIQTYTSNPNFPIQEDFVGTKLATGPHNWILLGLQAGYTMQLTGKIGINGEAALRMGRDAVRDFFLERRDMFMPVSVGIRYTIGDSRKAAPQAEAPAEQTIETK